MRSLSSADLARYRDDGFLTISGFFDEAELLAIEAAHDAAWRYLPADVVVDAELTGRRIHIKDVTAEERRASLKINDLYLRDQAMREVVMSPRLGAVLRELMQDDPVICNSLSVDYGTQQADHLDTLFMTPQTPGSLIAAWVALEDVRADAGPLRYYPESNHIEPYRFMDGGYHVRQQEMPFWTEYMATEVERHGLVGTTFLAKRGDLFVWDAWLLHGGSAIRTPGLTRRSLITHYYSRTDCEALGSKLGMTTGGLWLDRPPQAVPDAPPADATSDTDQVDSGLQPAAERTAAVAVGMDLHERLEMLDADHH